MIRLMPFTEGRAAEFDAMLAEYRKAGELHVYGGTAGVAWDGYPAYYEVVERMRAGGYPEPHFVPVEAYFVEENGKILGEVHIRHRLSSHLEKMGGHIGYMVRPSERNRGVATAALKLGLERLREIGVERALVTCDDHNVASARVIEKCGGARIEDALIAGRVERRYLVATQAKLK